jgi:hypothetical protein
LSCAHHRCLDLMFLFVHFLMLAHPRLHRHRVHLAACLLPGDVRRVWRWLPSW